VGQKVEVLIEGPSPESDLLIQGRMSTQAQEIDGHVLINDLGEVSPDSLGAGDLVEIEITEAMPHDILGRFVKVISRKRPAQNVVEPSLALN